MTKPQFLTQIIPAIAVIAGVGIAAAPAQAADFNAPLSTLEWDDATTDFNPEATAVFDGGAGNTETFDVTFSPESLGGVASVFIATGDFDPYFNPPEFVPVSGATGTFGLVSGGVFNPDPPADGIATAAEFELQNALTFTFDTTASGNGSPVTATLPEGTEFLGELKDDGAVEFELELGEWEFTLPNGVTGTAEDSVFEFGDLVGEAGGTYGAEGEVVHAGVPEPTTILGLLAVGGLSLGLKRKKQVS